MSASVEIIVPEPSLASVKRALGKEPGFRFETSPSRRRGPRLVVSPLDALNTPAGRDGVVTAASSTGTGATPIMFLGFLGALLGLAVLSDFAQLAVRAKSIPYVAPDQAAARRMLLARKARAESKLIASAAIEDGYLVVWSCEPKRYEVAVSEVPALAHLGSGALQNFKVSESGSRMHWPDADVDLDLDAIRAVADPEVRRAQETQRRKDAARYGRAIKAVRVEHKLKQSEVPGLSERQLRRLESGDVVPHASTLAKLAAAHDMTVEAYMSALAKKVRRKSG